MSAFEPMVRPSATTHTKFSSESSLADCGSSILRVFSPADSGIVEIAAKEKLMPLHSSMIDGVQVPGFRYVVYGRKRGYVSTHRTKRAAFRSLAQDARTCMRAGNPSDAEVYRWRDRWERVGKDEVDVELVELPQSP